MSLCFSPRANRFSMITSSKGLEQLGQMRGDAAARAEEVLQRRQEGEASETLGFDHSSSTRHNKALERLVLLLTQAHHVLREEDVRHDVEHRAVHGLPDVHRRAGAALRCSASWPARRSRTGRIWPEEKPAPIRTRSCRHSASRARCPARTGRPAPRRSSRGPRVRRRRRCQNCQNLIILVARYLGS